MDDREFLAERDDAEFWKWSTTFSMPAGDPPTQQAVHDASVAHCASKLGLSDLSVAALRMTLAARVFSPRVQVLKHLFSADVESATNAATRLLSASGAVVVPGTSGVAWTPEEVDGLVAKAAQSNISSSSSADLLDFDHVFPSTVQQQRGPTAVLYAVPGSTSFASFHAILSRLSDSGRVHRYIFRPYFQAGDTASSTESVVSLQGYGVELAIKNMEYKASLPNRKTLQ